MDPLTHSLVGGLAAKTVTTSSRRFWIFIILSLVPDLDCVMNMFGSWAYLFQHRGLSHSILGVFLQAVFFAWLLKRWDPGDFETRTRHYALPLGLHLLGDLLTGFGVPVFSPFLTREFSANLFSSVLILPSFITLIAVVWLVKNKASGWRSTRLAWSFWGLYILLVVSGKSMGSQLVESSHHKLTLLPTLYNPFEWRAIQEDGENRTYDYYSVDLLEGTSHYIQSFPMPDQSFSILASQGSDKVKTFLNQGRWPMARSLKTEKGWIVEWGQLLFSLRGSVRNKIHVNLNQKGEILTERNVHGFWDPK